METVNITAPHLRDIRIDDAFWSRYVGLVQDVILDYQWRILNDEVGGAEKSHCVENFRIAAGLSTGKFEGMVFQDSDAGKWLEAAAYSLESRPNAQLEKRADELIDLIGLAQRPDGYIDTYFTLAEPDGKWSNLMEGHELYVGGHLIEAAVAYWQATGKKKFLDIMTRYADCVASVFGCGEGQLRGYPGHPEIELALVKLCRATGCRKYLDLAYYFISERGSTPSYFEEERRKLKEKYIFRDFSKFDSRYNQTHLPPAEQTTAEGHAVRAVYLYTAMAELAYEGNDAKLQKACETIYDNIVNRRMFITGGIGSACIGERFTCDYDLPNDTNYSETCASVGLAMFCKRMLRNTHDAKYADTLERALYNTVLAGISADGRRFFYVNPLEVWPEACLKNPTKDHVKPVRQEWFGCACCPPNVARTLASLGQYVYGVDKDTVFADLYLSNKTSFRTGSGEFTLSESTNYPFGGEVTINVACGEPQKFTLALRLPAWSKKYSLTLGGRPCDFTVKNGYAYITRTWSDDEIKLTLDMAPRLVFANPNVRSDAGRAAVMKGPLVYCLEECDNGANLSALEIEPGVKLAEHFDPELLGGTQVVTFSGRRLTDEGWGDALYGGTPPKKEKAALKAVPYCLWNNRGGGEMLVWIRLA
jgi:DUF1680 family protein